MCGILAVLPRVCPCVSDTNRSSVKTAEWIELILGVESFFSTFSRCVLRIGNLFQSLLSMS